MTATDAVLQECELCHDAFPLRDVEMSATGQLLCRKCRGVHHGMARRRLMLVPEGTVPVLWVGVDGFGVAIKQKVTK
jgi:hypothetical protein